MATIVEREVHHDHTGDSGDSSAVAMIVAVLAVLVVAAFALYAFGMFPFVQDGTNNGGGTNIDVELPAPTNPTPTNP